MQAKATLQIKNGEERPFGEVTNAPKLAKFSGNIAYEGDMVGEGVLAELKIYLRRNFAMIYGLERFKGRIGEKSGSFVFQRTGQFDNGVVTLKWDVVPHSATGELKGLIGAVHFQSGPAKEFPITLNYDFETYAPKPVQ